MEVYIVIALMTLCLVLMCFRIIRLSREVTQLQEGASQGDVITQAVMGARKSVSKALRGHEMTQADKDARAAMYKELRERPDEKVEDASDKMSMVLQRGAPREMEGIRMVRVRPGPAINLLFDEGTMPELYRVETDDGFPVGNVEWLEREYGAKVLRITDLPVSPVPETRAINIILDAPSGVPGVPGRGRFVDIETDDGKSICVGNWAPRPNGKWSLRITELPVVEPKKPWDMEEQPWLADLCKDNK